MTIIVFLVDTSASMAQNVADPGRSSLLDIAKGAVESFVKLRQKAPDSRVDRYMLFTFEDYPYNVKAGWKENLQTFFAELKNIQAKGLTTMGSALQSIFDTLNLNRIQSGIDMYGQGRYPYYLEPAVIVVLTDGNALHSPDNGGAQVQTELTVPSSGQMRSSNNDAPSQSPAGGQAEQLNCPGSELTREPFRWDQRLYALVLRMAANSVANNAASSNHIANTNGDPQGHVASDSSPIDAMCEVTGGRSYAVTSHRILNQCIESLLQKLQSGVVLHFERLAAIGDKANNEIGIEGDIPGWTNCRRMIFVPRTQKAFAVGFWPLPEAFFPDVNMTSLAPRSAHPHINFTCVDVEPAMVDNLPFDKYELEPSPLTLNILGRKSAKSCWQVFVQGSGGNQSHHPFGYLKASTNLMAVNLFVLPYNYPVILPLLDSLFKVHRLKPDREWRTSFNAYLRTMPAYYAAPLRRALVRMGSGNLATSLVPETIDSSCLSYQVLNYLKRLKAQAKSEYDRMMCANNSRTYHHLSGPASNRVISGGAVKIIQRNPFRRSDADLLVINPTVKERHASAFRSATDSSGLLKWKHFNKSFMSMAQQLVDLAPGFNLAVPKVADSEERDKAKIGGYTLQDVKRSSSGQQVSVTRNPFDISRDALLDEIDQMRSQLTGGSGAHLAPNGQLSLVSVAATYVKHSLPIAQMGDYQDYLRRQPVPLRTLNNKPVRQHMFGNPFKINKDMILDEVIDDQVVFNAADQAQQPQVQGIGSSTLSAGLGGVKRPPTPSAGPTERRLKKGPLAKDFVFRSVTPPPLSPRAATLTSPVRYPDKSAADLSTNISRTRSAGDIDTLFTTPDDSGSSTPTVNHLSKMQVSTLADSREEVLSVNIRNILNDSDRLAQPRDAGRELSATVENELSADELRSIHVRNANMRHLICKEVKRPGKDYSRLFAMLKSQLHGPPSVRRAYLKQYVLSEAVRFKRQTLAETIEAQMDSLCQQDVGAD